MNAATTTAAAILNPGDMPADAPAHTCIEDTEAGMTAAQASERCPRCQVRAAMWASRG